MGVTTREKQYARKADLYEFLLRYHPNDVKREGSELRLRSDHSVTVRRGWCGFRDWSKGEGERNAKGNSVDFLVEFLGYDFVDAVKALCGGVVVETSPFQYQVQEDAEKLPPLRSSNNRQVWGYLSRRGITSDALEWLFETQLLYQAKEWGNAVFISSLGDYWEIHGTQERRYKRVGFKVSNAYWSIGRGGVAYICESAIDAVSLSILHRGEDAAFCSIGGIGNDQRIERIKKEFPAVVLAVDNDEAGDNCRRRHGDIKSIVPEGVKDWNDLIK